MVDCCCDDSDRAAAVLLLEYSLGAACLAAEALVVLLATRNVVVLFKVDCCLAPDVLIAVPLSAGVTAEGGGARCLRLGEAEEFVAGLLPNEGEPPWLCLFEGNVGEDFVPSRRVVALGRATWNVNMYLIPTFVHEGILISNQVCKQTICHVKRLSFNNEV